MGVKLGPLIRKKNISLKYLKAKYSAKSYEQLIYLWFLFNHDASISAYIALSDWMITE